MSAFGLPQVTQLVSDILRRPTFLAKVQNFTGKHHHPALFPREGTGAMRLVVAIIGSSLRSEVSLSNQLTPFAAGIPAPTPDQPANERPAWRPECSTPLSCQMHAAATRRGHPIVSPQSSISQMVLHPHGLAKLRPAQKSV
ncbi:hypothetical protein F5Y10DRAFT_264080 [Nemania abortiva]|nr:hypothetical protein F5Y10DRAFT_264080 [Nemania abortiva]